MENMELTVLVIGGTGFIGSNLIKKLIEKGFNVYAYIRPESSIGCRRLEKYIGIKYIYSSIEELKSLNNLPKFDICFNIAAYGVDYMQQNILEMIEGNIKFLVEIIDFCEKNNTRLLVNTGTCFEYGCNDETHINEEGKLNPNSLYGASKVAGLIVANTYAKIKNVNMITVRPFGIYGPDEGMHKLVPQLIETIIKNKELDMTSGEQVRDYLYVDDLAEAYIELSLSKNIRFYQVYNVCSSQEITIRQLAHKLCKISDYDESRFNYGAVPYRENEVMYFVGDNSKIYNTIGWKPKVLLEDGLKLTLNWYKENSVQ